MIAGNYRFFPSMMLTSRPGGDDSGELEAGLLEQGAVLDRGSFLAARDQQHDQIEELAVERLVPRRNDTLDDEQFACRRHRAMAVAQDRQALRPRPNRG